MAGPEKTAKDPKNADLIKRFDKLAQDRAVVQESWDAIETFITPYRGRFFNSQRDEGSIEWFRHRQVFDSTAVMAHQTLAASLHGSLTSPSIRWFEIRFRQAELNKSQQARQWLQECNDLVFYALQDSNFNLQINESYQDLAGFGTSFVIQEEAPGQAANWNGLEFHSVPLKEGYFEIDANHKVLRFFRRLEWTPAQILSKFPADQVPLDIVEADKQGNQEKRTILYCVTPRHNKPVPLGERQYPSRRPWEFRYIDKQCAETIGKPGGYYEQPVMAPRWRVTSSSVWGNSPAHLALADVLSLNEARKLQLMMAEKIIDPPIFAEERAIITDLSLKAGSLSVVRAIEGIHPFNTEGSWPVSDALVQQLQAAVRNYFFTDQINFPDPQAQPMTATEAQIRYELMQRLLGPTLGRLQNDLLDPIVERTFRMLARAGRIPEPPQIVREMDAKYEVEYLGSLVRAQRQDNAAAIERFVMVAGNLGEVMPGLIDSIDQAAVMTHLAQDLNVPADIVRDEDEVREIQEERSAQQAQMQEAAVEQQQGEAMTALAEGEQQQGPTNEPGATMA